MSNAKLFESITQILHGIESYHDSFTLRHENATGKLMSILSKAMGFDEQYCIDLEQVGSVHDIGKLAIPAKILEKSSSLSVFEREVVEMHTVIGKAILDKVDHPLSKLAANVNISHHESYDGSGYPFGLKEENIPIEGRICSICDVYDAIRSRRPYREGMTTHMIVLEKMLSKKSDGLYYKFDPEILRVFSQIHEQFDDIYNVIASRGSV